ncbi:MAG: HEPN family nuclease [Nitrososphaerales archaeon]
MIKNRNERNDVHEVTQLVLSLLGLIVFPWEALALKSLESLCLSELEEDGWPRWNILLDEKGDTNTLGKLSWHLRNAISHRRLRFFSEDQEMDKVEIEFEDAPQKAPINWRATINAKDLKSFCDRFTKRLEELVD